MLNPDLLNRRALNSPLVQFCTALILALMFTATTASAQTESALAGPDQTVDGGGKVTLTPNLDTNDMFISWGQVDPAGISLITEIPLIPSNIEKPSFNAPTGLAEDLVLMFEINVVRASLIVTDTVTITVRAGANRAPTASAGPDQTVGEGATVTLDGSASSDPDNNEMLTFAWTQTGGADVTLSAADTSSPTFTAPDNLAANAVFRFQLVVTDARGLVSSPATMTITVLAGDSGEPPTARAGPDQTVDEGATVTLDGSASSDPDNNEMLTFSWTQIGSPQVTLSAADTSSPTFIAPTLQAFAPNPTLEFQLVVTDAVGLMSSAATVTITLIKDLNNPPPTARAGPDQTVGEGDVVSFDGSTGGTDLTFSWTQIGGPQVTLSAADTTSPTFTAPDNLAADTVFRFQFVVTDARGTQDGNDDLKAEDTVTITVSANRAPTANAGPDQTVAAGVTVTLDGSASSDPDNNEMLTFAWTQTGGADVTLSAADTSSPTFIAPTLQLGAGDAELHFQLIVTDAGGLTSPSATVTITLMKDLNNPPPTANAGPDQTVAAGVTVTLDGSASSDPDNNEMLTFSWTQTGGADVTLSAADTSSPTFIAPTLQLGAGDAELQFQLIVTDAVGLMSSAATVTITLIKDLNNPPPTANAGPDQTVAAGVTVTLDGSASSDPDNNEMLTFSWTQTGGPQVTLSAADTTSPTFTAPDNLAADTVFRFQFVVTDARGTQDGNDDLKAEDTVTITVSANRAPTVLSAVEANDRPGVAPATTDPTGKTITLPTSEEVNIVGKVEGDFTVTSTLNGETMDHRVTDVRTGSIILDVSPSISANARITVRYDSQGSITNQAGTPLDSFPPLIVLNRVTAAVERVQKTVETINRFLHTRTTLILANQPKLSRRINRLQRGVGSEQLSFATGEITKLKPFEFNFLSLGSGNYKFATSMDQVTRAADHLQVMQGDVGGLTATHERRRFDVWFEGSFNKFNGSAGSGGDFAIAYLGADYLVSPDLLLGALLQYDRLSDSSISEDSMTEGKGWMAGPYVTARLQDNLYLDARLAWGKSDNDIRPPGATYTDSFTSIRRLANISLSGEFSQGQWTLRPNASLSYMADKQSAYTNTLGTTIPSQTVSSGQLRLGPNVSTQFTGANGWVYEPSVTLDAIYSHADTRGGLSTTPSPQDGWRARLEAGLGMTLSENRRLTLTGNYDGIGQSGFESWGLGLNVDMRF